jgi:hypothetical protein
MKRQYFTNEAVNIQNFGLFIGGTFIAPILKPIGTQRVRKDGSTIAPPFEERRGVSVIIILHWEHI